MVFAMICVDESEIQCPRATPVLEIAKEQMTFPSPLP